MKVTNIKNKVINIGSRMVLPDESIEISDDYRNNGVIRKLTKMGFIRIEEDADSANADGTDDDEAERLAAEKAAADEAKKKAAAEKKAAAAAKKAAAEKAAADESSAKSTEDGDTEK